MKTRNLFAGAVVGALAVGIWLGSFWKGPGLGGLGTGFGTGSAENEPVSLDSIRVDSSSAKSTSNPVLETNVPLDDVPKEMMTVVIYGSEYRLVDGETPQTGKLLTLNEIAARAKQLTGTPEGIRIRILKGKNAQEGARADLMQILTENGVKREEIQERADFVD